MMPTPLRWSPASRETGGGPVFGSDLGPDDATRRQVVNGEDGSDFLQVLRGFGLVSLEGRSRAWDHERWAMGVRQRRAGRLGLDGAGTIVCETETAKNPGPARCSATCCRSERGSAAAMQSLLGG